MKKCLWCSNILPKAVPSIERKKKFCSNQCHVKYNFKGRPKSEAWKKKASTNKIGDKNPMWKGDKAGYAAIHGWVKGRSQAPLQCDDCGEEKPLDLANISQEYLRELSDWEWLCRKCHMTKDGRLDKLKKQQKTNSFNYTGVRKSKNISGCLNIYWNKRTQKWKVQIRVSGKSKHVGYYGNIEDAKKALANLQCFDHQISKT